MVFDDDDDEDDDDDQNKATNHACEDVDAVLKLAALHCLADLADRVSELCVCGCVSIRRRTRGTYRDCGSTSHFQEREKTPHDGHVLSVTLAAVESAPAATGAAWMSGVLIA